MFLLIKFSLYTIGNYVIDIMNKVSPPPPPPPDFRLHSRDITGLFWQLSWELIVLHCKRKYSSSLQFHRLPKLLCSMECWWRLGNKMNRNTGSSERQWVYRKRTSWTVHVWDWKKFPKIRQRLERSWRWNLLNDGRLWQTLVKFFFFFFFFESVVQRGSAFQLMTIPC